MTDTIQNRLDAVERSLLHHRRAAAQVRSGARTAANDQIDMLLIERASLIAQIARAERTAK